jgi:hypothetical protein
LRHLPTNSWSRSVPLRLDRCAGISGLFQEFRMRDSRGHGSRVPLCCCGRHMERRWGLLDRSPRGGQARGLGAWLTGTLPTRILRIHLVPGGLVRLGVSRNASETIMNSNLRRRLKAIADDLGDHSDAFRSIGSCGDISICLRNCDARDVRGCSSRGLSGGRGQARRREDGFG